MKELICEVLKKLLEEKPIPEDGNIEVPTIESILKRFDIPFNAAYNVLLEYRNCAIINKLIYKRSINLLYSELKNGKLYSFLDSEKTVHNINDIAKKYSIDIDSAKKIVQEYINREILEKLLLESVNIPTEEEIVKKFNISILEAEKIVKEYERRVMLDKVLNDYPIFNDENVNLPKKEDIIIKYGVSALEADKIINEYQIQVILNKLLNERSIPEDGNIEIPTKEEIAQKYSILIIDAEKIIKEYENQVILNKISFEYLSFCDGIPKVQVPRYYPGFGMSLAMSEYELAICPKGIADQYKISLDRAEKIYYKFATQAYLNEYWYWNEHLIVDNGKIQLPTKEELLENKSLKNLDIELIIHEFQQRAILSQLLNIKPIPEDGNIEIPTKEEIAKNYNISIEDAKEVMQEYQNEVILNKLLNDRLIPEDGNIEIPDIKLVSESYQVSLKNAKKIVCEYRNKVILTKLRFNPPIDYKIFSYSSGTESEIIDSYHLSRFNFSKINQEYNKYLRFTFFRYNDKISVEEISRKENISIVDAKRTLNEYKNTAILDYLLNMKPIPDDGNIEIPTKEEIAIIFNIAIDDARKISQYYQNKVILNKLLYQFPIAYDGSNHLPSIDILSKFYDVSLRNMQEIMNKYEDKVILKKLQNYSQDELQIILNAYASEKGYMGNSSVVIAKILKVYGVSRVRSYKIMEELMKSLKDSPKVKK